MALYPLTSIQVSEFLPLNTWTEVYLQPCNLKNIFFVSTYHKMEKRKKDMQSMLLQSSFFDKVTEFEFFKIVGVEIEGKWFRGKLISFNEFVTKNTIVQLIDYGTEYSTKLESLFELPYFFTYEPLALPVIFKDFIPNKTTFSIKPLLSESNLYERAVIVDVNCDDTKLDNCINEKQLLESKKEVSNNWQNGDHVEFLFGKDVDNIYCILKCIFIVKHLKPVEPKTNEYVTVYSKFYKGIYRAKVLMPDSNNKNMVKCSLIDFGKVEMIPTKNIFSFPKYVFLYKVPPMVCRVSLIGVNKNSNQNMIAQYLSTLKGKKYVMEYDKKPTELNRKQVILRELQSGASLYDDIQKLLLLNTI
eukprot:XP_016659598.1 PREDICTED: uncharacterized protein LOC107883650 [Acyrthosiphon pisum]